MPSNKVLNLYEGNTDTITLTITRAATGTPENLTDKTVEVLFKADASTADDDAAVTKLSSPDDVVISDAASGTAQFVVPSGVVATPGSTFWRCDVVAGESRRTSMYGAVVTENL